MLDFLTSIWGYLGLIWCIVNLVYYWFRNDAGPVLVYGISIFAAALVFLNIGGILNPTTWGYYTCGVWFAHMCVYIYGGSEFGAIVSGLLLSSSVFSVVF